MDIAKYFSSSSKVLLEQSNLIKLGFAAHHPSSGSNKEDLVGKFLEQYLPGRVDVDTGLIFSKEGIFSNEADLLVTDRLSNAPLFPEAGKKLWYAESVYAMIEAKSLLNATELDDCAKKCKRFKSLTRDYATVPSFPNISDSLFIIWAFDGLEPLNMKKLLSDRFSSVEVENRPDMIIVPDKYIVLLGQYHSLARYGQRGSTHYHSSGQALEVEDKVNGRMMQFSHLKENTLLAFIVWLTSWINAAGQRSAPLQSYLPENHIYGEEL